MTADTETLIARLRESSRAIQTVAHYNADLTEAADALERAEADAVKMRVDCARRVDAWEERAKTAEMTLREEVGVFQTSVEAWKARIAELETNVERLTAVVGGVLAIAPLFDASGAWDAKEAAFRQLAAK